MSISTDPGVTKYLFGMEMFVGASNDIKYIIGETISTYPFFAASHGIEYVIEEVFYFWSCNFFGASCGIKYFSTFPFSPSCTVA